VATGALYTKALHPKMWGVVDESFWIVICVAQAFLLLPYQQMAYLDLLLELRFG